MKKHYGIELGETNWDDIELGLLHIRQIYLQGRPGSGKTYAALKMGLNGRPSYSVTMTPDTPSAELRGFYVPHEGKLVWQDGPAIRAMREGGRLVINEITNASADCMAFMYPILEDITTACITLPTKETVWAHDDFQVVCTDNRPFNLLEEALQSRLTPFMCDEPHESAMALFPTEMRATVQQTLQTNSPDERYSLRHWIRFMELRKKLGHETAARLVFKEGGQDLVRGLALENDSFELEG